MRGLPSGRGWDEKFKKEKKECFAYLRNRNVPAVLGIVFDRLYQLRNQILHGGTTFAETWGRPQMKQGCEIMSTLVPAIIDVMESDIERDPSSEKWGNVAYPRGVEPKDWE